MINIKYYPLFLPVLLLCIFYNFCCFFKIVIFLSDLKFCASSAAKIDSHQLSVALSSGITLYFSFVNNFMLLFNHQKHIKSQKTHNFLPSITSYFSKDKPKYFNYKFSKYTIITYPERRKIFQDIDFLCAKQTCNNFIRSSLLLLNFKIRINIRKGTIFCAQFNEQIQSTREDCVKNFTETKGNINRNLKDYKEEEKIKNKCNNVYYGNGFPSWRTPALEEHKEEKNTMNEGQKMYLNESNKELFTTRNFSEEKLEDSLKIDKIYFSFNKMEQPPKKNKMELYKNVEIAENKSSFPEGVVVGVYFCPERKRYFFCAIHCNSTAILYKDSFASSEKNFKNKRSKLLKKLQKITPEKFFYFVNANFDYQKSTKDETINYDDIWIGREVAQAVNKALKTNFNSTCIESKIIILNEKSKEPFVSQSRGFDIIEFLQTKIEAYAFNFKKMFSHSNSNNQSNFEFGKFYNKSVISVLNKAEINDYVKSVMENKKVKALQFLCKMPNFKEKILSFFSMFNKKEKKDTFIVSSFFPSFLEFFQGSNFFDKEKFHKLLKIFSTDANLQTLEIFKHMWEIVKIEEEKLERIILSFFEVVISETQSIKTPTHVYFGGDLLQNSFLFKRIIKYLEKNENIFINLENQNEEGDDMAFAAAVFGLARLNKHIPSNLLSHSLKNCDEKQNYQEKIQDAISIYNPWIIHEGNISNKIEQASEALSNGIDVIWMQHLDCFSETSREVLVLKNPLTEISDHFFSRFSRFLQTFLINENETNESNAMKNEIKRKNTNNNNNGNLKIKNEEKYVKLEADYDGKSGLIYQKFGLLILEECLKNKNWFELDGSECIFLKKQKVKTSFMQLYASIKTEKQKKIWFQEIENWFNLQYSEEETDSLNVFKNIEDEEKLVFNCFFKFEIIRKNLHPNTYNLLLNCFDLTGIPFLFCFQLNSFNSRLAHNVLNIFLEHNFVNPVILFMDNHKFFRREFPFNLCFSSKFEKENIKKENLKLKAKSLFLHLVKKEEEKSEVADFDTVFNAEDAMKEEETITSDWRNQETNIDSSKNENAAQIKEKKELAENVRNLKLVRSFDKFVIANPMQKKYKQTKAKLQNQLHDVEDNSDQVYLKFRGSAGLVGRAALLKQQKKTLIITNYLPSIILLRYSNKSLTLLDILQLLKEEYVSEIEALECLLNLFYKQLIFFK